MNTAIILCSRSHSSRVPGKCFIKYQGITHIEHLIMRLLEVDLPIYVAVPENEVNNYMFLLDKYPKRVFISAGFDTNPLARTYTCAKQNNIKNIVRVTHDKIFVDTDVLKHAIDRIKTEPDLDYIYSSDFIPGTGFEIISYSALESARQKFPQDVEHISYAIKAVATKQLNYKIISQRLNNVFRLLVDYPEDVKLMDIIFSTIGVNCTLRDVTDFMEHNPWLRNVNKLPLVSIYTCAYNAEKWITESMGSVAMQENFSNYEYILIDDDSKDKTLFHMGKFCNTFKNTKFYRNIQNVGLSSSSNRALKIAKGKYIIRLDADDYFLSNNSVMSLVRKIEKDKADVVYPNYYMANKNTSGRMDHHIGGALFDTSAINHVKFTERLRGHDSLDVFLRAKDQLKITYLEEPIFYYRQHNESLTKNNIKEREEIKQRLLNESR
jgi:spore coat polysaccharide biosynthesis protein SpsF (cytidylyltransferase family)